MVQIARDARLIASGEGFVPPATRLVHLPGPLRMHRGGELPEARIAFETWGRLAAARDNAILIFTGLSPSAHAASSAEDPQHGWWEYMIGPGRPIDTDRFYVICINSLGSCFGSTGPASVDPRSGETYRLRFPELSIEDIAAGGRAVAQTLGIPRLHTVLGPSMGGMAALAYALLYPEEVENLVLLCTAVHALPFAIAVRSLQREVLRSDPAWSGGDYPPDREPYEGMRLARKLGLMSYRSASEWDQRFGREPVKGDRPSQSFGIEFQVESYLEANARKFIGSFDANCYLYLSRSMDWFDVADHGGTVEAGLSRIEAARTLVIGVETDILFPLRQQKEIVDVLRELGREVHLETLSSLQGHDAFLVDEERFAPVLRRFLSPGR